MSSRKAREKSCLPWYISCSDPTTAVYVSLVVVVVVVVVVANSSPRIAVAFSSRTNLRATETSEQPVK